MSERGTAKKLSVHCQGWLISMTESLFINDWTPMLTDRFQVVRLAVIKCRKIRSARPRCTARQSIAIDGIRQNLATPSN